MPNDTWHKHFALCFLGAFFVFSLCVLKIESITLGIASIGYLWGAWMFNPDTFSPSASQNAWGPLKFIWGNRFYHFAHHGIVSHSPIIWVLIPAIMYLGNWNYILNLHFISINISWFIFFAGVSINAGLHLICDLLMMVTPKPIRKILGF